MFAALSHFVSVSSWTALVQALSVVVAEEVAFGLKHQDGSISVVGMSPAVESGKPLLDSKIVVRVRFASVPSSLPPRPLALWWFPPFSSTILPCS